MSAPEADTLDRLKPDPEPAFEVCFFQASRAITKSLALVDGKIKSTQAPAMDQGTVLRLVLSNLTQLAERKNACQSHEAFSNCALRDGLGDKLKIITQKKLDEANGFVAPNTIARTKDNFVLREGQPAAVLLDHDSKAMPNEVRERITHYGDVWNALKHVMPSLEGVGNIIRASTSSGLRDAKGDAIEGSDGQHIDLILTDGSDTSRFLTVLLDRCWLAGMGWFLIAGNGALLKRGLIDISVADLGRLVFEGSPLLGAGLAQDKRQCRVTEGHRYDSRKFCLDLTDAEKDELAKLETAERLRLAPAAEAVREDWLTSRSREIQERTKCSAPDARRQAVNWCNGALPMDMPLPFDLKKLEHCTVRDVLDDPAKFNGATLADPVEPDYGAGRGLARIFVNPNGTVVIHSYAHGSHTYELMLPDQAPSDDQINPAFVSNEIDRLSRLPRIEYGTERKRCAQLLLRGVGELDVLVDAAKARRRASDEASNRKEGPRPGETRWPLGYSMKPDGLYCDEGEAPIWVCPPFEVLASGRDANSEGWAVWLRWCDDDGRTHNWAIPLRLFQIAQSEVEGTLVDRGLSIPADANSRARFRKALSQVKSGGRVRTVDRPGWHHTSDGEFYIVADGRLIEAPRDAAFSETIVLKSVQENASILYAERGTLEGWQTAVAGPAKGNSVAMFAICGGLAGPIFRLAAEPTGGAHLAGGTKLGKTLAGRMMVSLWGNPSLKGGMYRDWHSTATSMELAAEECNDSALFLDELHQAQPQAVVSSVYMLGNESGRGRSKRNVTSAARKSWSEFILSTGEMDIRSFLAKTGLTLPAGAEIRLSSIRVEKSMMWPCLHGHPDARTLMGEINQGLRHQYGTAGPAFLAKLVELRNQAPEELTEHLSAVRKTFADRLPANAESQVHDVARRLATVAWAGELAIEYDILPWAEGDAVKACTAMLALWVNQRGGSGSGEDAQRIDAIRLFLLEDGSSRFVAIRKLVKKGDDWLNANGYFDEDGKYHEPVKPGSTAPTKWVESNPGRTVVRRAGWRLQNEDGLEEYIIPAPIWDEVCVKAGIDPSATAKTMRESGFLAKSSDRNTVTFAPPGMGKGRYYRVLATILADPS